ncbi:hypothetical protein KAX17_04845, partial [Candidatus Bipolaricaulota bacterium]|nr:hypothetical protein [Candidatus Bipolaricaulota bacterium]
SFISSTWAQTFSFQSFISPPSGKAVTRITRYVLQLLAMIVSLRGSSTPLSATYAGDCSPSTFDPV